MIKINPKLVKDDKEYSINIIDSETGEALEKAITLSGKDIKEILGHLFWSTTDAIKSDKLSPNKDSLMDILFGEVYNGRRKPYTTPRSEPPKPQAPNKPGFDVI